MQDAQHRRQPRLPALLDADRPCHRRMRRVRRRRGPRALRRARTACTAAGGAYRRRRLRGLRQRHDAAAGRAGGARRVLPGRATGRTRRPTARVTAAISRAIRAIQGALALRRFPLVGRSPSARRGAGSTSAAAAAISPAGFVAAGLADDGRRAVGRRLRRGPPRAASTPAQGTLDDGRPRAGGVRPRRLPALARAHDRAARATSSACGAALAPGGVVVVTVPNFGCWQARRFRDRWYHLDLPAPPHALHRAGPAPAARRAPGCASSGSPRRRAPSGCRPRCSTRSPGRCLFPGGLGLRDRLGALRARAAARAARRTGSAAAATSCTSSRRRVRRHEPPAQDPDRRVLLPPAEHHRGAAPRGAGEVAGPARPRGDGPRPPGRRAPGPTPPARRITRTRDLLATRLNWRGDSLEGRHRRERRDVDAGRELLGGDRGPGRAAASRGCRSRSRRRGGCSAGTVRRRDHDVADRVRPLVGPGAAAPGGPLDRRPARRLAVRGAAGGVAAGAAAARRRRARAAGGAAGGRGRDRDRAALRRPAAPPRDRAWRRSRTASTPTTRRPPAAAPDRPQRKRALVYTGGLGKERTLRPRARGARPHGGGRSRPPRARRARARGPADRAGARALRDARLRAVRPHARLPRPARDGGAAAVRRRAAPGHVREPHGRGHRQALRVPRRRAADPRARRGQRRGHDRGGGRRGPRGPDARRRGRRDRAAPHPRRRPARSAAPAPAPRTPTRRSRSATSA